jgi:hypothetical protein
MRPRLSSGTLDARVRAAWQTQLHAARKTPGLLVHLSRQRQELLPRFAALYQHLQSLPKRLRRHWQRRFRYSLAGVALVLTLQPSAAWAANLTAGTAAELITAITTANGNGEDDIIFLTADITLTAANNTTYGPTGLPVISSKIIILGQHHTLSRDSAAPDFRLLAINGSGHLAILNTTLSGGRMPDAGGGIAHGGGIANYAGQLLLAECTVSGNSASGHGGGGHSLTDGSDTVAIIYSTLSDNSAGSAGGGVGSFTYQSSRVTLSRTLIAGNINNAEIFSGIARRRTDRDEGSYFSRYEISLLGEKGGTGRWDPSWSGLLAAD